MKLKVSGNKRIVTTFKFVMKKILLISLVIACGHPESKLKKSSKTGSKNQIDIQKIGVQWIVDEVINLDNIEVNKPVFVYITAKWCTGCRQTEQKYFHDSLFSNFINYTFLPVKVDGESTVIILNNRSYGPIDLKHELLLQFGNSTAYPNLLIFDEKLQFKNSLNPNQYWRLSPLEFVKAITDSSNAARSIWSQYPPAVNP